MNLLKSANQNILLASPRADDKTTLPMTYCLMLVQGR